MFLPSALKSRVPTLDTLRRSVRTARARRPLSRSLSSWYTPELPKSITDLGYQPDDDSVTRGHQWEIAQFRGSASRLASPETLPSIPSTRRPQTPLPETKLDLELDSAVPESQNNIDWDIALPGFLLLDNAHHQAVRAASDSNSAYLRKLYIDGFVYVSKALPPDLTERELEDIDSALPIQLKATSRMSSLPAPQHKNILRRSVTYLVLQVALIISLALPYLHYLVNQGFHYDCQHRLTERLLTSGIGTVDLLGQKGLNLRDAAVRFGHGRVGATFVSAGLWILEGVLGGFSDGLGKGLVIVGQAVIVQQEV